MTGRTGSRGGSRSSSSASAKVPIQQAKNTVKLIQTLGLTKNNSRLVKAYTDYEKNIRTARGGIQRNEQEMRELPDDIERAGMRGQFQQEAELEHSLETTRPKEKNMYQKWANRLESNLKKEAQSVMADKNIANEVPKDHEITSDEIDTLRARFH
ncbi:hypothetical protein ACEPAG_6802 [Sanghuangporus baumii]